MRFRESAASVADQAPRILGAVLCGLALLASSACNKKSTPDWDTPGDSAPTTVSAPAPKEIETPKPAAPIEPQAVSAAPAPKETASASESGLRFIAYNVENWLTMDRYVERKQLKGAPKPENEKEAVVRILVSHQPDVIGICEIGTAADLAEIQEDLKAAGLNLPNSHFTGGTDPTRHLGLLSRFPITSTAKPAETEYQLAGQTFGINRGVLDATVEARGKSYRFLGVHLKSKRDSEQGDQEAIRLSEARLLRQHVDSIFKTNADARLVVYGDFNDTRATKPLKMITGKYNDPTYLTAIPAKDSNQEAWTHYWELNDIYSRIDFIMVSKVLRKEVDFPASKIIDDAEWKSASDHRPLMAIFK
ncbi:MAG: endonuclease/exonuclease/phosphatase family protein [Verrucomicrobiota bacterium]